MNKINFCCIFGGKSSEYEVSLCSACGIIENTDSEKYNVIKVGITKNGNWYLYSGENRKIMSNEWINDSANLKKCFIVPGSKLCIPDENRYIDIDVCFPAVHGANCEDGKLQGYLDICNVKYVGPGCTSSAVCMDKDFTKTILLGNNVPMADFITVSSDFTSSDNYKPDSYKKITERLGNPVFVKPANAGSSVGASVAWNEDEFISALKTAFAEDSKVLIEQYIKGKEVEVAVMGKGDDIIISMPGEIDPGAVFYDYDTKYKNDTAKYYIPARIKDESIKKIREYASVVYKALGCKGLSRVDFFVTTDERIIFNEINTLPGFTPISMYPKMFISFGMSYKQIIDTLLQNALNGN